MSIASRETLAPGSFSRHLVSRKRKSATRKKLLIAGLSLTSMVDMFSLLVIFLLQAFSASPELLAIQKGVTLPAARTGQEIKDAPVLAISEDEVYLDQKLVGKTQVLIKHPEPLMNQLASLRELWQKTHPTEVFPGEINLQAHKDLSSTIVAHFMAMLPSQSFGSIQLAVVGGGG